MQSQEVTTAMTRNRELESYRDTIFGIIDAISKDIDAIARAAEPVADAIAGDGLVHVIGPGGHSNMAVEEVFWRAGGFAAVNGILDPGTNLIHGGARSMAIERTPGYAISVLDAYRVGLKPGELLVIANAYGVNAMCIDLALEARRRRMTTIAITSRSFADSLPSNHPARHPSGRNLYQEVDHFLDNHLPYGDAVIEIEGTGRKMGPTSTFCNVFTINLLMIEAAKALAARGVEPPVLMSGNLPGGDAANRLLLDRYGPRVKHLL
jgi:uncharacterized phosphosugar-binding protein